jgi:linoleoyl-CoA desaturase
VTTAPRFVAPQRTEFALTLRTRVKAYFTDNNISQKDNGGVFQKGVVLLAAYLLPWVALLALPPLAAWIWIPLAIIQGIGAAGLGMCVMHDSLHGAYSKKSKENTLFGYSMYMLGCSPISWQVQHNRLHHTYTNILGHDDDIRERSYMRLSANAPWRPIHQYQRYFAPFLYSLMTFSMLVKDFTTLRRYEESGYLKELKTNYKDQLKEIILIKVGYVALLIVLPIVLGKMSIGSMLGYFAVIQLVAGLILAVIFQLAHAVEEATHPLPNTANNIENEWMIHQMETTVNFCPNSPLLNWYTGGLNYQVEHHLFPNICHVHYPALSSIVRDTAKEFGVVYHQSETFGQIWQSHMNLLINLGKKPDLSSLPPLDLPAGVALPDESSKEVSALPDRVLETV